MKDPNAPKKPLSAYFMFLQRIRASPDMVKEVFGEEVGTTKQSVLAAAKWRSMSDEEKKVPSDHLFLFFVTIDEYILCSRSLHVLNKKNSSMRRSGVNMKNPSPIQMIQSRLSTRITITESPL